MIVFVAFGVVACEGEFGIGFHRRVNLRDGACLINSGTCQAEEAVVALGVSETAFVFGDFGFINTYSRAVDLEDSFVVVADYAEVVCRRSVHKDGAGACSKAAGL